MHRHRPQPTPGQLSLKLKLPKVRRVRQHKQNWQLTLADSIDRLPRLSVELHRQLELDLSISRLKLMEKIDRSIAPQISVGQRCPTIKIDGGCQVDC